MFHEKGSWLRKHGGDILDVASMIPWPGQPFVRAGSALVHGGQAVHAAKEGDWQKALGHGVGAGVQGKLAHSGFTGGGASGIPIPPWMDEAGEVGGSGSGLGSILGGVGGVLGGIGGWAKDNPGLAIGIGSALGGLLSPQGAGAKESDELKVELMKRALHNLDNPRVFNPYIKAARGAITGPQYLPPTPALVGEAGPEFITPLRGAGDQRAAANILGMPAMRGGGIIPALPKGYEGWVNGPHIATLGENGSEAVFPLDKLQTAAGGAISGLDNLRGGLRDAIVNSIDDPNRQGSNSFVPSMLKAYDEIPKLQAGGITKGQYKQQKGIGGGMPPPVALGPPQGGGGPMPPQGGMPPPVAPGPPQGGYDGGMNFGQSGSGPPQGGMPPPVALGPPQGGSPVPMPPPPPMDRVFPGGPAPVVGQPGGPTKEQVMGRGAAPSQGEGRVVTLPDGTQQFQMNPPSNLYNDPDYDKTYTNRNVQYLDDPNLGGTGDIPQNTSSSGVDAYGDPDQGAEITYGNPDVGDVDPDVNPDVNPDVGNSEYPAGTLDPSLGRSLQDVALQGLQNTPDYDALYDQLGNRAMGLINESAAARGAFGGSANRGQLSEGLGRLGLNIAQLQGNLRNQALQGGTNVNQNVFGINRDIYGMNQMGRQQAWQNAMNAAGQPTSPSPWQNFFSATGNLGGQIYNTRNSPWQ